MINRKAFTDALRSSLFKSGFSSDQVTGFDAILDEWEKRGLSDLRWLAYIMATVYHETAHTMKPIREYGLGKGRKYGVAAGPYKLIYYGRGWPQLTWYDNYVKQAKKLGVALDRTPDLMLEYPVSAAVTFGGMIDGDFTGKKLGDYFSGSKADWVNARRIVNGTDKADTIAGYGKTFYAALLSAWEVAPVPAAPAPQAPIPSPPDVPTPAPAEEKVTGFWAIAWEVIKALFR